VIVPAQSAAALGCWNIGFVKESRSERNRKIILQSSLNKNSVLGLKHFLMTATVDENMHEAKTRINVVIIKLLSKSLDILSC